MTEGRYQERRTDHTHRIDRAINIGFQGQGQMAEMMSKMGGATMTYEVLSASTDAISDSTFEIPAGYKVTKR